ncbi:DMT family transporter [Mesobacillus subterraneus]|uniref:DMT family transporter n=1 Tax=Mesobacillus subterraneus TaxID=285983 RepID=UPI002042081A|nr:DMT family transporter [Mesobacillus subterraneus]MCM3666067.1 DMT family transporter [Mesobacillus subterraneus]MCM3685065.1 DMT family transporter [Mesobacillus subterraneus]
MLRLKGILMIVLGAMLWGMTGSITEWVLANTDLSVPFILTVRLIIAGGSILAYLAFKKEDIFTVVKTPYWRNQVILFSVFGMVGLQFTFSMAIETSNAVVATLLQFSAPIFVVLYVSFSHKKWPPRFQTIGIAGTLVGLFLLLTNGSLSSLLVSTEALLWGVAVGLTFAFYTLYPSRLMKEYSVLTIVGWSMLIGGIMLGIVNRVWQSAEWSIIGQPKMIFIMVILIFFGTLAFLLFLSSMNYISAVETSILSSVEPLTVMIISVIWFDTMLQNVQMLGAMIMLTFVTWLSIGGNKVAVEGKNTSERLNS